MLRQQQGFQSVMPSGKNVFRDQFERVLPASSVANLYPFNYSGKTDPHGFYVGRDKFGSNVLVDFNQRAEDKTNGSILILENSGQGKSYLLKLILCNLRESGMNIICLDPEMEYEDLTNNLQGCFIDLMGGRYIINPLEPKVWDEGDGPEDPDAPETFRISSRLSQHISFLKDFFRSYKDFTDREIDVIEIMLQKLYQSRGLSDQTDFQLLEPEDYLTLSEMYDFIEAEYKGFDEKERQLYTAELLQNILLGLHSMCKGAESKFFNGHTNITDSTFVTFGVKGLLQASKSLKNALLKMDREEIYEMVIREMTETAVRERNEQSPEEQELQEKVARLSKEMQEKIKDLPEDVKKAITDYVEATLLAADHDCLYLYEQRAKDCVVLLKKLGVL